MSLLTRGALLALSLNLAACALGAPTDGTDQTGADPGTLTHRLSQPTPLALDHGTDASAAAFNAVALADGGPTSHVELGVIDGAITVDRTGDDGVLRIEDLVVDVDDVTVSPNVMPPNGLHVTGISAVLDRPVRAEVTDETDDHIEAVATISVALQWSAVLEHGVVELAPIHLVNVPVTLEIDQTEGGQLVASLHAERTGSFWTWAETFELRDLSLDLSAADAP